MNGETQDGAQQLPTPQVSTPQLSTRPRGLDKGGVRAGLIGLGVIVLVALLAVVVLVASNTRGRPPGNADPGSSAADNSMAKLTEAAARLSLTPGSRLRGTIPDRGLRSMTVDARVSTEGSIIGTLTGDTSTAEVLVVGGRAFLKAGRTFWLTHDAPVDQLDAYSTKWVKIGSETLGLDLASTLNPGLLAAEIAPDAFFEDDDVVDRPTARSAGTARIDGTPVDTIDSSAGYRVSVTTAEPRRIVRITKRSGGASAPTPGAVQTVALRVGPGLEINLADLSPTELERFHTDLQRRITELKTSVDTQVQVSFTGNVTLAPCTTSGCRANVRLSNTVRSNSPYLSVKQPVRLSVTITMTLDGRPVRTCVNTVTMPPNGSATTTCFATYTIPPERQPKVHQVQAESTAYGLAMIDADVQKLAKDVAAEIRRSRQLARPNPTAGPTGGGTAAPSAGTRTYPCREPAAGHPGGGPGQWTTVNRGGSYKPDAPWRRYQEQVSGVKLGTEYRVQRGAGKTPVDFEGFELDNGKQVYIEAKGRGYAGRLAGAEIVDGKLVVTTAAAQAELDRRLAQLRRQLEVVAANPGARLRFFAEEQAALDRIRTYAQANLGSQFDLIDWHQQDQDWDFTGCP